MKAFMDRDFLLENETARALFHTYAENQPIYDYHNHLPPQEIAERKRYENLTQLWLTADHYKWRAMRACGVDEQYITGGAPEYEKFRKWAEVVPQLAGCPLYHWTHLELQRYFEIYTPLTPQTAPAIWEEAAEKLKAYDAASLLEKMNVRVLCTTDDPADTLEWHKKLAADSASPFRVLPSFRPDKYLGGNPDAERALCEKYGTQSLPEALEKALDVFCENGDAGSPITASASSPTSLGRSGRSCCVSLEKRIMRAASRCSCTSAPSATRTRACLRQSAQTRAAPAWASRPTPFSSAHFSASWNGRAACRTRSSTA